MTWNRRSVLRVLGTTAFAPVVLPMVQACGTRRHHTRRIQPLHLVSSDEVRIVLREVVAELSRRFPYATGTVIIRRSGRAMSDADERRVHRDIEIAAVLEIAGAGRRFEQVTGNVSRAGILQAASALRARASAGYQSARPAQPLASHHGFSSSMAIDPHGESPGEWLPRVSELYQRSKRVGGSRIVYRGAYLLVDDVTEIFVGAGHDLQQRLVRTRSGVALVAQRNLRTGSVPVVEVAERNGLMGLEATSISLRSLEAAADRVLAMVSPSAYQTGDIEIICDPGVASLLARECVGRALDGSRWLTGMARARGLKGRRVGSELVTLVDDPSASGAYGSYFFDQEGMRASPSVLIDKGILVRPITDRVSAALLGIERTANGRRADRTCHVRPELSNTAFQAGESSREQLITGVERGFLLEGGLIARVDIRTWRFFLRAARAHEIRGGKTTGVLYGNVEIRGDVPRFLQDIRGVSSTVVRTPATSRLPATMGSPYILSRAELV